MSLLTNIVAYWKTDEASGNAADSVGSNTLSNTSCSYAAGKINNGVTTTGGRMTSGTSPVSGSGDWSVSCWYKSSASGSFQFLWDMGQSGGGAKTSIGLWSRNINRLALTDPAAGDLFIGTNSTTIDGNWHHVVVTKSGNVFTSYVDNVVDGTATVSGWSLGSNLFKLGIAVDNSSYNWQGMLDEVGVWSRALTTGEISELYNNGAGLQYPFLGPAGGSFLLNMFSDLYHH